MHKSRLDHTSHFERVPKSSFTGSGHRLFGILSFSVRFCWHSKGILRFNVES